MENKDLSKYNDEQLKKIAKHYNISGYEDMSRKELVSRIDLIINPEKSLKTNSLAKGESKQKLSIRKVRNDSGIYVHKNNWKTYMPRIVLAMFLIFEIMTMTSTIISSLKFGGTTYAFSNIGSAWISLPVKGHDWGFLMVLSCVSIAWTMFIFYRLIKFNTFNYFFFFSILLNATYHFYFMFNNLEMMMEAQKFLNANSNNATLIIQDNFKPALDFYWAMLSLTSIFFIVPSFVVVVNLITKNFML